MSNFIDLADRITERLDVPYGNIRLGIHEALAYLDRYPDQAPGRTITESDFRKIEQLQRKVHNWTTRRTIQAAGVEIVPDPEPPNAEKWETFCKQLRIGLKPWQIDYLVAAMDKRGVTAPGGAACGCGCGDENHD